MIEQDYLNHISLPAKLYDKIESDVADLFMDLNIREYPVDPMQIALDLGYDLVPFTQMPKEVKRELISKDIDDIVSAYPIGEKEALTLIGRYGK